MTLMEVFTNHRTKNLSFCGGGRGGWKKKKKHQKRKTVRSLSVLWKFKIFFVLWLGFFSLYHVLQLNYRWSKEQEVVTTTTTDLVERRDGSFVTLRSHHTSTTSTRISTTTTTLDVKEDEDEDEELCPLFPNFHDHHHNNKDNNINNETIMNIIPHYQFSPRQFFEQGIGRPYLKLLEHTRQNFTDLLNARFLVYHLPKSRRRRSRSSDGHDHIATFWNKTINSSIMDGSSNGRRSYNNSSSPSLLSPVSSASHYCRAVYFHIHKNGGTTMERQVPLPMDNFYSKREKSLGHIEFERQSSKIMQDVYQSQQQQQVVRIPPKRREQHQQQQLMQQSEEEKNGKRRRTRMVAPVPYYYTAFSFLRDPVPRFLSSVAQVLKLRVWHKRLYPCYEYNTTEQLIDCVLTKLEHETQQQQQQQQQHPPPPPSTTISGRSWGNFLEMHLVPQSFELYKQVMNYDISITVMDISNLGTILQQTRTLALGMESGGDGGGGGTPPSSSTNDKKERSTAGTLIRRFPHFRLTMDVLTPDRIQRICNIYQMDVLLIQETGGITDTVCPIKSHTTK